MTITKTKELEEATVVTQIRDLYCLNLTLDQDKVKAGQDKYVLDLRIADPREIEKVMSTYDGKILYSVRTLVHHPDRVERSYIHNFYEQINEARGFLDRKDLTLWLDINCKKLGIVATREKSVIDGGRIEVDICESALNYINLATLKITKRSIVKKFEDSGVIIENCNMSYSLHGCAMDHRSENVTVEISSKGSVFVHKKH